MTLTDNLEEILPICISGVILLSTIPIIMKMKNQYTQPANNDRANKNQYLICSIFCIITVLALTASIMVDILKSTHNHSLSKTFWVAFLTLYALHSYILLLLLFCRLYYVFISFVDPIFRLKKQTICAFRVMFITTPVFIVITLSVYCLHKDTILVIAMVAIFEALMMVCMIALIGLFLLKLTNVLANSANHHYICQIFHSQHHVHHHYHWRKPIDRHSLRP
eukprot:244064_1